MCTVTYIPQQGGHFILTSNRDEQAARSPRHLSRAKAGNFNLIFPRDTTAGGSWIAVSDSGRVVCLLNGAFEKHRHEPPYRFSRGIMVLDFFTYPSVFDFLEQYDFLGLEPFTMVIVDQDMLAELRWDGQNPYFKELDNKTYHIWSSATLYPADIRLERERWFKEWLTGRHDFSLEAVREFHQTGGQGDSWNGLVMNRDGRVQTVSITSVVKNDEGIELIYDDLLRKMMKRDRVLFQKKNLQKQMY